MNDPNQPKQQIEQLLQKLENASEEEKELIIKEIEQKTFQQVPEEVKEQIDNYVKSYMEYHNRVIVPMQNFVYPEKLTETAPTLDSEIQLNTYEFETVRLQNDGNLIQIPNRAKYFIENLGDGIQLEMVYIPSGEFLMGSNKNELNDPYAESFIPQHLVKVPAFFLGKFSITQEQWIAIMENNLSAYRGEDAPKNLPVENTSWFDAVEFCHRLSLKTGRNYRLPSEAEWEYACRANTTTSYAFGNEIDTNLANYWAIEDDNAILSTKPVGSYYPNAFGLYDMHGNVYELCHDAWHNNYEGAPNDGSAWANGNESQLVVIRGGSFDYYEDDCRSAHRSETPNHYRYHGTGFRIACSI